MKTAAGGNYLMLFHSKQTKHTIITNMLLIKKNQSGTIWNCKFKQLQHNVEFWLQMKDYNERLSFGGFQNVNFLWSGLMRFVNEVVKFLIKVILIYSQFIFDMKQLHNITLAIFSNGYSLVKEKCNLYWSMAPVVLLPSHRFIMQRLFNSLRCLFSNLLCPQFS